MYKFEREMKWSEIIYILLLPLLPESSKVELFKLEHVQTGALFL